VKSALSLLLALVLLAGCASDEKRVLRLNPTPSAETKRVLFPPITDGEVPRYLYVGELLGDKNFVDAEGHKESSFKTALRWLVGLFDNEDPVVLQRPQAGLVDESGRILVTDVSRGAIYVFDDVNGRLDVWELAEGFRHFVSPSGIALGPEGRVFVSDADLQRVFLLDRNGKGIGVIGKDQLLRPTGIAWDAHAALLYVSDTQAHQIKVFDMTGRLVRTLGRRGEGPGEFNFPTHIALSHDKLYVTDTMNARIQVISPEDGQPELVFGERGTQYGNLVRPKGVAVDSESNVYVVESYHDHLLVYDRKGRFLLPIGGTGKAVGNFYLPGGVWVDSRNRVYVADTFNGRIVIFQFLGGGVESE
jgi:DNA-binding beta-propeller fold protein YncE